MRWTKEGATSATTTVLRTMRPLPSAAVRPLERRMWIISGRDARQAGNIPKRAADTIWTTSFGKHTSAPHAP